MSGLLDKSGAALVVLVGIVAVTFLATVALLEVSSDQATIVGGAATAIGTIVGAFFGVKAGSATADKATAARDAAESATNFESSKVQYLATQLDSATAPATLEAATQHAVAQANARAGTSVPPAAQA